MFRALLNTISKLINIVSTTLSPNQPSAETDTLGLVAASFTKSTPPPVSFFLTSYVAKTQNPKHAEEAWGAEGRRLSDVLDMGVKCEPDMSGIWHEPSGLFLAPNSILELVSSMFSFQTTP